MARPALLRFLSTAKAWGGPRSLIVAHQPRILAPVPDQLLLLPPGAVEAFGPRDKVLERMRPLRPIEMPARPVPVRAQARSANSR